jgi:hypothetical protein
MHCIHGRAYIKRINYLNIRLFAHELHAHLEAPEAAVDAAEDDAEDAVGSEGLEVLLDVHGDRTEELDEGDDQRAKGSRAQVESEDNLK